MHYSSCKPVHIAPFQSFLMTTGAMTTFIWTSGLAQHMYLLVTKGKHFHSYRYREFSKS